MLCFTLFWLNLNLSIDRILHSFNPMNCFYFTDLLLVCIYLHLFLIWIQFLWLLFFKLIAHKVNSDCVLIVSTLDYCMECVINKLILIENNIRKTKTHFNDISNNSQNSKPNSVFLPKVIWFHCYWVELCSKNNTIFII